MTRLALFLSDACRALSVVVLVVLFGFAVRELVAWKVSTRDVAGPSDGGRAPAYLLAAPVPDSAEAEGQSPVYRAMSAKE